MRTTTSAFVVVLLLTTVLTITPVSAASATPTEQIKLSCDGETQAAALSTVIEQYNNNTDAVPSVIASAISSNTTQFWITDTSQNITLNADTSLRVTSYSTGAPESPDTVITTNSETTCTVIQSETPAKTFTEAYNNGAITVEANGTVNKAKLFVIEQVMKLSSLLN